MTLTLTLVRHGQTHFNQRRLLQGSCDSPLTRPGRDGVRLTARHLAGTPFVAAYASPSGRAVTTAVEILRHHPSVRLVTDADLREYDFGAFERRPEHELEAAAPWAELIPEILAGRHPGLPRGEHAADYMARIARPFAAITARHAEGDVLVVGHGLSLAAWLSTIDPTGLMVLPNASVTTVTLEPDGTGRVLAVGVDIAGHGTVAARPVPSAQPVGA
jgi:probable phosphoglycerate mutase